MHLSTAEEELMQHLWSLKKAYMSDLLDQYEEPKPAPTTIATLLKRMQEKGFVSYNQHGRSRQYYPLVEKTDYFGNHVRGLISKFFNNSSAQFASFFTTETNLSAKELEDLRAIIDKEIKRKGQ